MNIQWRDKPWRVHGNGFVQVDLAPKTRLHVWHPYLPRQKVPTPIHDHRFGFTSEVLVGELLNVEYRVKIGYEFNVHEPQTRDREDTVLVPTGDTVSLEIMLLDLVRMGGSYEMQPGAFHETFVHSRTATVMTKTSETTARPRVLVPRGLRPDNEWNRYEVIDEKMVRDIITDVLGS